MYSYSFVENDNTITFNLKSSLLFDRPNMNGLLYDERTLRKAVSDYVNKSGLGFIEYKMEHNKEPAFKITKYSDALSKDCSFVFTLETLDNGSGDELKELVKNNEINFENNRLSIIINESYVSEPQKIIYADSVRSFGITTTDETVPSESN